MLRLVAAAVSAGLVAIALGCGGGGDSSSAGGENISASNIVTAAPVKVLTKPNFIAHVNALCRRKWRFVMNAVRQTRVLWEKQRPQVTGHGNFIRSVRVSFFASLNFLIFDSVRRLGVPPDQKQAVEGLLEEMQAVIERGSRKDSFATVAQLKALFSRYNREARQFGLNRCLVSGAHLPHPET
jgi:hypothetical protein